MAGLAPTLIIVRVAYGKSVDSVQQMLSIHFATCESQQEAGNRGSQTPLDIQSSPHHNDTSGSPHVEEAIAEE
ncbi:hypothetical protein PQX77_001350 [Marasmius sp. AFHP31]|nr:hypothetical protein PQX77_001350 [Marasmius sp. AFHP31]